MCRLLGINYGPNREELDTSEIAAIMFPALVHQGPHAYGWMSQHEDYGIHYEKHPGRCDTDEAWERIIETVDPNANWFVGHVRFATHGRWQDNRNNHPIPHGNIVGVHNGVLKNHNDILKVTGRDDPKTIVDSEAIFAAVEKWGPKKGLAKIRGTMVSIWGDWRKQEKLFIARTQGRQLTIGWTRRGNLIFASERQALERLRPEIEFTKFSTISENRMLTLQGGEIIARATFREPAKKIYTKALQPGARTLHTPRGDVRFRGITEQFDNDSCGFDVESATARALANRRQARATSRGAKLFPKERPGRSVEEQALLERRVAPQTEHAREWLAHASNNTLVEWNGVMVTPAEYEWLTGKNS